jgi:AraC family transcriptional regulator, transcriptional activator of pobA
MSLAANLPLFHLYGDPPDEQAFDFIHIEPISSRSSPNDWTIGVHRHSNLWQILVIERGGGEMRFEVAMTAFSAPAVIVVPAMTAHGFQFQSMTEGWVLSFTEDAAQMFRERSNEAITRLKTLAFDPVIPMTDLHQVTRLRALCAGLQDERLFSREGFALATHGYLALIAIEVVRLAKGRGSSGAVTLQPADPIVERLRQMLEENFRKERSLDFYATKLAMTPDRLNDHVKRATGVTAGHLIRQRVLIEAKRQLVFSKQPIHEIAYDLAFADPSHFVRFFRNRTGTTPQIFRALEVDRRHEAKRRSLIDRDGDENGSSPPGNKWKMVPR